MDFLSRALAALAGFFALLSVAWAQAPEPRFVGSTACAGCHESEHGDWLASQHRAAMQEPNDATVLGRFDGASFRKGAAESVFFRKEGRFFIRTGGPDGKAGDFPVRYVFGVAPLQQYLLELPGGRLQAFGIAWDSRPREQGGQRWFDLYPDRQLTAADPLHWSGIDQNWNYQCAWCHSTNLRKNYDEATGAFSTRFSEISVGCEACHGPASQHLAWAAKPSDPAPHRGFAFSLDQRAGVAWRAGGAATATRAGPPADDREALVCAGCHARRQQFSDDPAATARFYDAFRPVTLEEGLYHVDGQQRDEVYNFGSFMQSRMHVAGVTCSDCHNPHSGKLRLSGAEVCGQCHSAQVFDQRAHHYHENGSAGAQCVNCHMPATTYMGVDARHDHSMRIPRPDRTANLGTPNACNQCHADRSANWAADAIRAWGGAKPGMQSFAEAFRLADSGAAGGGGALARIVEDESQSALARASALMRLSRRPPASAARIASRALLDKNPMVRAAAVAVIARSDAATKREALAPLLSDETRLVRMDAARALAGEAEAMLAPSDLLAFEKALAEYEAAQRFNAERPESHANLGALRLARGKVDAARDAYARALALDPTFAPAAVSLADILSSSGNESAAEETLRRAVAQNPGSGPLAHALGLSLIRQKRVDEALQKLEQAIALAPDEARFAYVYGVALHDTGAPQKARETLERALARHPNDRDILMALAFYDADAGDYAAALSRAELLGRLEPEDRSVQAFLAAIREASQNGR